MTLRSFYRPLRPDLDNFLFAAIGDERNGIPLSMVSALTRLGLDPWDEAERLSSLSRREAVEQLARLIAELPDASRPLTEAREIAGGLVEQLPKHDSNNRPPPPSQTRPRPIRPPLTPRQPAPRWPAPRWPTVSRQSLIWAICVVTAVVMLTSTILHGGFPFGI